MDFPFVETDFSCCTIAGKWRYNEHDVCINAEMVFDVKGDKMCEAHICVSQNEAGKWVYGFGYQNYNGSFGGSGRGSWLNRTEAFSTQSVAVAHALQLIISKTDKNIANAKLLKLLNAELQKYLPFAIDELTPHTQLQLQLF